MLKIAAKALHEFLELGGYDTWENGKWSYATFLENIEQYDHENPHVTEVEFASLQTMDIKQIVADRGLSENHIGGDDVISYIDTVLAAVKDGYEIITWYGPETQALIVGVRPNTIEIEKG